MFSLLRGRVLVGSKSMYGSCRCFPFGWHGTLRNCKVNLGMATSISDDREFLDKDELIPASSVDFIHNNTISMSKVKRDPPKGKERHRGQPIELVASIQRRIQQPGGAFKLKLLTADYGIVKCLSHGPPVYDSEVVFVKGNWQHDGNKWIVHVGHEFGGVFTHLHDRETAMNENGIKLLELSSAIQFPSQFFAKYIKNIGPVTSKKLVGYAAKHNMAWHELLDDVNALQRVVGHHRGVSVHAQWTRAKTLRSIFRRVYDAASSAGLDVYDVLLCAQDAYDQHGILAPQRIKYNPYTLVQLDHSVPFSVCEAIHARECKLWSRAHDNVEKHIDHVLSGDIYRIETSPQYFLDGIKQTSILYEPIHGSNTEANNANLDGVYENLQQYTTPSILDTINNTLNSDNGIVSDGVLRGITSSYLCKLEGILLHKLRASESGGGAFLHYDYLFRNLKDNLKLTEDEFQRFLCASPHVYYDTKDNTVARTRIIQLTADVGNALMRKKENPKESRLFGKQLKPLKSSLLTQSQLDAINNVLDREVAVLTGKPGSGKTTVIASLVKHLENEGVSVSLVAPTGRAAMRMNSLLSNKSATTIHRMARIGLFQDLLPTPLHATGVESDVVIVDEASMVSVELASSLFKAIGNSRVYFVGDPNQLPPIAAHSVFDIAKDCDIFTQHLTEVHRQNARSHILDVADQVLDGNSSINASRVVTDDKDFFFVPASNEELPFAVLELVTETIPRVFGVDPFKDIQILTPFRKCGVASVHQLNTLLQEAMVTMHGMELKCDAELKMRPFYPFDKVIQTRNNRYLDVYNGEMGIIQGVFNKPSHAYDVKFDRTLRANQSHVVAFSALQANKQLELAYAMSIHKSQGSEFPIVVIPFSMSGANFWNRNLLYTAITRAKRCVVCVGQEAAWHYAVHNMKTTATSSTADKAHNYKLRHNQLL
eukprot:m.91000 g.91000  ORF g.91000 m.91000 type:complete len:938 (-) comp8859_c0_seq3:271-3084(-)